MITITIDSHPVEVAPEQSVLDAARKLGIDIPTLCYLEKCGPLNSCLVCLVKINGKLVPSCGTKVQPGMVVESETEEVHEARRTALELLFSDHIGDCLSPCHRLCPLGLNIPVMIRQIQGGQLPEASATVRGSLPLVGVLGRLCHHPCEQGCRRGTFDDPAAIQHMEQFVADWEMGLVDPPQAAGASQSGQRSGCVPPRKPATGKTVAILGGGPTGLTAAYYLARHGHTVTVVDRHPRAGGSLRAVPVLDLPAAVVEAEIAVLAQLGVEFKLGVEVGNHVTVEGLARGYDAILLTLGELTPAEGQKLGMTMTGAGIKTDPNTCQTPLSKVFAAGAAVKPVKQLVRAMTEGRAAAECVQRFLSAQPVRRPEKPFSSIMGRLDPGELKQFLLTCSNGQRISCDRCTGYNHQQVVTEAARCMHCDCRSSGNCVLQHYAQVYG
ncbi:MAG TPA: FAD-dependent oxidoreductase, partial [Candidatus Sulfotelmatobacter sp.]|nr:FAD-dependent oxidoreductase [Candidatus Sulfotelmatobacter sp.]